MGSGLSFLHLCASFSFSVPNVLEHVSHLGSVACAMEGRIDLKQNSLLLVFKFITH